jgi:hypothetical protein
MSPFVTPQNFRRLGRPASWIGAALILLASFCVFVFSLATFAERGVHSLPLNGAVLVCAVASVTAMCALLGRIYDRRRLWRALVVAVPLLGVPSALLYGAATVFFVWVAICAITLAAAVGAVGIEPLVR